MHIFDAKLKTTDNVFRCTIEIGLEGL